MPHGKKCGSIHDNAYPQPRTHPHAKFDAPISDALKRTLLLTGASRGIGHATVIRFSSAGWRVITCSRHPFPEQCPWDAGPEDHIQVDLADHKDTARAIDEIRERLNGGDLHALVNNAAISPKAAGGRDWARWIRMSMSGVTCFA